MILLRCRLRCVAAWAVAALLISTPYGAVTAQEPSRLHCAVVDVSDPETETGRDIVQEIYTLLAAWREAVRQGDIEGVVDLITEDAEFWSQGATPVTGQAALTDAFRPFFADYELLQDFECHELVVRDDLAVMRGLERNHLIPRAGGDTVEVRQRAFSIMRRSTDGRWRFARGMTNQPQQQ
ncbi:MAG: SgcJ/EcaC family oxidoreductase [Gemmatimonadales bacterium]|nr:SgcJ/EcaC family oxidoreductase [Gemmatimonadales bacterium]